MHRSRLPTILSLLAIGLSLGLAGCLPNTITLTLGGSGGQLTSSRVMGEGTPKIALIDLRGLITETSSPGLFDTGGNMVDAFLARLDLARKDAGVKAVIVRINSPGGSVVASELLYSELRRFREETGKPVIASMGEVAASGGYYIALAADEIVADASSATGSIGVLIQTVNASEGLGRLGIVSRSVVSGPNKAIASPFEPMREAHYAILQQMVDEMYERFTDRVRDRRPGMPESTFAEATDGRVYTGARAVELGAVDHVGGLREALDRALALADLPKATLIKYHTKGAAPRTAYAMMPLETPGARTGVEVSARASLGGELSLAPGRAYFVWAGAITP